MDVNATLDVDGREIRKTAAIISIVAGVVIGTMAGWGIWYTSGHISRMTFDRVKVNPLPE